MSENKLDPEVKKAIWKIVLYAVTVLAAAFGGNVAAKNGYRIIPKPDVTCSATIQNR